MRGRREEGGCMEKWSTRAREGDKEVRETRSRGHWSMKAPEGDKEVRRVDTWSTKVSEGDKEVMETGR